MFKRIHTAVLVPMTLAAGSVMAAVPEDVTTATTAMKADAVSVATVVLVAIIAVAAIKFIRKGL